MSISKSYNKRTGIHYAYETTYEWSEERQKKVQRRHCIGQFDPDTGEIIPNGKVGRPGVKADPKSAKTKKTTDVNIAAASTKPLAKRLKKVEYKLSALSAEINALNGEISLIRSELSR